MKDEIKKPQAVLTLTDEQLLDYIKCPDYFNMKYISPIPFKTVPTYNDLIKKMINIYLSRLLQGRVMTMASVKKVWDSIIEENPNVINTDKKVLEGIGLMNLLNQYCRNNKILIADVNSPYSLNFGNNIIVKGNLGVIRYCNNKFELFIVEPSQKIPDQTLLDMSLKYTLQLYAAHSAIKNQTIAGIKIFHIKTNTEFTTTRSQKDFERMKRIINGVGAAIRNNVFYPREDYTCPNCSYKNYCGYI